MSGGRFFSRQLLNIEEMLKHTDCTDNAGVLEKEKRISNVLVSVLVMVSNLEPTNHLKVSTDKYVHCYKCEDARVWNYTRNSIRLHLKLVVVMKYIWLSILTYSGQRIPPLVIRMDIGRWIWTVIGRVRSHTAFRGRLECLLSIWSVN